MAKESQDVKLARIEEEIKHVRTDVSEIKAIVPMIGNLEMKIALIQRDEKWKKSIIHGFVGLLGIIVGALVEFWRK